MNSVYKHIFCIALLLLVSLVPLALPLSVKDRLSIMTAVLAFGSIVLLKLSNQHHNW